MEFLPDILMAFDQVALLIATAMGAVWFAVRAVIGRFGIAILTGLGRGAGTGIGSKLTGGGSSGSMSSRRMPSNSTGRHARQALWNAEARQMRMKSYVDAWCDLLATRGGPYALSIHLQSLLASGFLEKIDRLQRRCAEFDRLEAIAQRVVQRYERDYARNCEPIRDEVMQLSIELVRWKARNRRRGWKLWQKRWWHNSRNQWRVRNEQLSKRWELQKAEFQLSLRYRAAVEPALSAVDQYERSYLMHWVHSFEADLESFRLTVMTGRLLDLLFAPQAAPVRQHLGLAHLPRNKTELRAHLIEYLGQHGVAFGPLATVESLFEAYLRTRLIRDPQLAAQWNVNRVWLERALPAPGSMGISGGRHFHMATQGHWHMHDPQPSVLIS